MVRSGSPRGRDEARLSGSQVAHVSHACDRAGAGISDVITLGYFTLSGDMTMRVVLKVLTVGSIGAGVFAYYLRDVREKSALDFDGGTRVRR